MNINANITFEAQTEDQFLGLIEKLKSMGVTPQTRVSAPKQDNKGPHEIAYGEATGKRFRLTDAEQKAVERGETTREELAKARLAESSVASSDDVMDGPALVETIPDDGEELT